MGAGPPSPPSQASTIVQTAISAIGGENVLRVSMYAEPRRNPADRFWAITPQCADYNPAGRVRTVERCPTLVRRPAVSFAPQCQPQRMRGPGGRPPRFARRFEFVSRTAGRRGQSVKCRRIRLWVSLAPHPHPQGICGVRSR